MLRDRHSCVCDEAPMKAERCKPDYEAQIKQVRERLGKTISLKSAIINYISPNFSCNDKLAEMIGELVVEEERYNKTLDNLIERQEQDN